MDDKHALRGVVGLFGHGKVVFELTSVATGSKGLPTTAKYEFEVK